MRLNLCFDCLSVLLRKQTASDSPTQSGFRRTAGWILSIIAVAAPQAECFADEYRERVRVAGPTNLDWTFVVANRNLRNPPSDWLGAGYDSTQQTYELFVPDEGAGSKRPLVLFVSSTDKSRGWRSWSAVCRRYGIIFAGPHKAGKNRGIARRIRVILDVLHDVRKKHDVDPDRTYICGIADGAHVACRIGYMLPECFGGMIAIGGGEILPKELWLRRAIADRLSVIFLKRDWGRRKQFSSFFRRIPESQGIRVESRSFYGSPTSTRNARMLASSFHWLDADVARRRELARRFPSTREGVGDDGSLREDRARQWMADATKRLGQTETLYPGLLQLEGLRQRWPDLAVTQEARTILDDYHNRRPQPWRLQYLEDREKAFWSYETLFNEFYAYIHGHRRWRLPQPHSPYPEEHAVMSWGKPARQAAADDATRITYDGAAHVQLDRLGTRVGFDAQGSVRRLDLSGTLVIQQDLHKLKEQLNGLSSLRALDLSVAVTRGLVLGEVSDLQGLRQLNLSFTDFDNTDLSFLADLANLQTLALVSTDVSSLNQLGFPKQLRTLILGGTRIGDGAIGWLNKVEDLQRLSLFSTPVTDIGVEKLQGSLSIEYLNLGSTRITNGACSHVAQLPSLTTLILDHTDVTDLGIESLSGMESLRHLSLTGCGITDLAAKHLKLLPGLESVDATQTKITAAGVAELESAVPRAQVWWTNEHAESRRRQRDRILLELFLNRFEDQYRKKLLQYQQRYYGPCLELELPLH